MHSPDSASHSLRGSKSTTYDLSVEAISIVLSSHPVYGADPTGLGTMAEITLALPLGYVRLSGNFLRLVDSSPKENLFVFMIEGGKQSRPTFVS